MSVDSGERFVVVDDHLRIERDGERHNQLFGGGKHRDDHPRRQHCWTRSNVHDVADGHVSLHAVSDEHDADECVAGVVLPVDDDERLLMGGDIARSLDHGSDDIGQRIGDRELLGVCEYGHDEPDGDDSGRRPDVHGDPECPGGLHVFGESESGESDCGGWGIQHHGDAIGIDVRVDGVGVSGLAEHHVWLFGDREWDGESVGGSESDGCGTHRDDDGSRTVGDGESKLLHGVLQPHLFNEDKFRGDGVDSGDGS